MSARPDVLQCNACGIPSPMETRSASRGLLTWDSITCRDSRMHNVHTAAAATAGSYRILSFLQVYNTYFVRSLHRSQEDWSCRSALAGL